MKKRQPCIYKITNLVDGKVYIGQTNQTFNDRMLNHKSRLRRNKHSNVHLQRAWNKYGEVNFSFDIVQECDVEELDNLECAYIELHDSCNRETGYNLIGGGNGLKVIPQETIDKIVATKFIKVVLVNTGEVFDSLKEASTRYGVGSNNITMCCKKQRNFAGRLENGEWMVWRYLSEYNPNEKISFKQDKRANNKKKITCLNTLEVFDTIKEAAEKYQVESQTISKVLNGWQKSCLSPTHGRLQFSYGESFEQIVKLEPLRAKKKIICLTTNEIFESVYSAVKTYKLSNNSNLHRCLKGERAYCGKLSDGTRLKWAYHEEHLSN